MTPAARPRLIINADDFGVSPGVNRAVIAAFRQGVLTSASLVMNAAHTEEALALAAANPGLRVGLHLNLTGQMGQRPLAPPAEVPLLVDEAGRLKHGFLSLLALSLRRPAELGRQAEREMQAQIEAALARGLTPAHLDSHRHVHHIPLLFEAALRLKTAYNLPRLRRVNESLTATRRGAGLGRALLHGGLVKLLALKTCAHFHPPGPPGEDTYFYSLLHSTRLYGRNLRLILVPPGYQSVELCFHPSLVEEDARDGDQRLAAYRLFSPDRQREFEALLDPALPERVVWSTKPAGLW